MRLPVPTAACAVAVLSLAQAQTPGQRALDTNAPFQISADSLEVQQDNSIATFRGRVEGSQDDMRLKADVVRVYYRSSGSGADAAAKAKNGGASIYRVEAIGHVFVSRPNQTAQGERGTYDLDKRVIVLEGNVVLTERENIVKGNRVTMDLAGKQSIVEQAPGGRVQGVFQPRKSQ